VSLFVRVQTLKSETKSRHFNSLDLKCFKSGYKKKATSAVSIEIHKGAIFDRLKINFLNSVLIFSSTAFL
jgi:hypothetical protein